MDSEQQQRWRQRLLHYQMQSVLQLEPLPQIQAEEDLVAYLARNKARQKLGASRKVWVLRFWSLMAFVMILFWIVLLWTPQLIIELTSIEWWVAFDEVWFPYVTSSPILVVLLVLTFPYYVGVLTSIPLLPLLLVRHFQRAYTETLSYPHSSWYCNFWGIATPEGLRTWTLLVVFVRTRVYKTYTLGCSVLVLATVFGMIMSAIEQSEL